MAACPATETVRLEPRKHVTQPGSNTPHTSSSAHVSCLLDRVSLQDQQPNNRYPVFLGAKGLGLIAGSYLGVSGKCYCFLRTDHHGCSCVSVCWFSGRRTRTSSLIYRNMNWQPRSDTSKDHRIVGKQQGMLQRHVLCISKP